MPLTFTAITRSKAREVKIRERVKRARDSGVEVVQIDPPETLHRGREIVLDVGLVRHVGGNRETADLLRHPGDPVAVEVDADDTRALGREPAGGGPTKPAGSAGDDRDLVRQALHSAGLH